MLVTRTADEPHALASATLAFTCDGLAIARPQEVVVHSTSGATRVLNIVGARQLVALDNQLWAVCDQRIERWSVARRCRLGEIRIERDVRLVPTFAGPAVASCGARRWRGLGSEVCEEPLAPGALPVVGTRTLWIRRHAGARFAMFGAVAWRLPACAEVVAVAALFDGNALALFVSRRGAIDAWISTLAGDVRHRVRLPNGAIRLAARRGLVVVHDGTRVSVFDLRQGRALGSARARGTDIAIDPDGRYLAIEREGELVINTLDDRRFAMEEEEQMSGSDIVEGGGLLADVYEAVSGVVELDGAFGDTVEAAGEAAGGVGGMGALPAFGLMNEMREGAEHLEEGDYAHAGSDGIGVLEKGAELIGQEGAGEVLGLAKGGFDLGMGIAEIATDEEGFGEQSLDGIDDMLHGGGEAMAALGPEGAAVGTVFGASMDVGEAIAPYIFGSEEEDNQQHTEEVPGNADGSEGQFYPSTGNGAVDWVFGTGDYTEGRW